MRTLLMTLLLIGTCMGLEANPFPQQTQPVDKLVAADHKVKRDSNGDRV